jgi:hypothetical protein
VTPRSVGTGGPLLRPPLDRPEHTPSRPYVRPCPNGTPDAMPPAPSPLRPGPRSSGVSATGADRRRPGRDSPIRGADGGHSRIDRDRWGGLDARRHGAALAGIGRSSGRPGVRGRPPPGPRGTSGQRLPPSSSAGSSGPTSASEPPCGRGASGSTTSVPAPFQAGIGYTTTSSRNRSRPRRVSGTLLRRHETGPVPAGPARRVGAALREPNHGRRGISSVHHCCVTLFNPGPDADADAGTGPRVQRWLPRLRASPRPGRTTLGAHLPVLAVGRGRPPGARRGDSVLARRWKR